MTWRTALLASCIAVWGCGGAQTSPETASDTSFEPETTDVDDPVDEPSGQEAPGPGSQGASEFGDRPEPMPEDWTPTRGDCAELASHYEDLLRAVELEKLEKRNLNDKLKQAALNSVEATVKQGVGNWLTACEEIVGKIQVRGRWKCATSATNLDRFNGCMNGKFDDELER